MKKQWTAMMTAAALLIGGANARVWASQSEIAAAQADRAYAESQLASTQAYISSLASQQEALQAYLGELNAQAEALVAEISSLSQQAGEKEVLLQGLEIELQEAIAQRDKQYEAMKARIVYIYENGGSSVLTELLFSDNLADFINRAEKIRELSDYDRKMLEQYEAAQAAVEEQEQLVQTEIASINALLTEKGAHQEELEELMSTTNVRIASYAAQIGASSAEAAAWVAEIQAADASIAYLLEEAARAEAARAAQAAAQSQESTSSYDSSTGEYGGQTESSYESYDTGDSSGSGYDSYESSYDSYESYDSYDSYSSGSSSSGTYLGNFTLTAYCNCASCCGVAGGLTASGTVPSAGRTVAMGGIAFGTQLLINGNVYTVEDRGTAYGHVDIFFNSHSEALAFGLQSAEVYQLN